VIDAAARQLGRWAAAGRGELQLSINLSTRHFAPGTDVVVLLRNAVSAHALNPRNLRIEITESALIENVQSANDVMRQIAALGIEFAVDDFGTGYSSLSYLRRFPISEVKIDRSFITDLTTSAESMVIVRAIVAMAHALGARVVAEGVETAAQYGALARMRCDLAQGYLISRPLPAAQFDALPLHMPLEGCTPASRDERTLLLVDDEPNIAASLKRLLRRDGYRILTATSAAEGLELLGANAVGVIISDQRMPVMCGTEFLRSVKSMYPDTVRMVLSGFTDLASITSAINEGAIYKFLTKPWEDEVMRTTVREAFERHDLLRENERLGDEARAASLRLADSNTQLERRVAEKTSALSRQLEVLKVAQETLDRIPLGVIGVDTEGMIATANEYAMIALGAAPGSAASDCLPGPLVEILAQALLQEGAAEGRFDDYAVVCSPLGRTSAGRGSLLFAIPAAN
jgi:EAL domain-containing protein (putative c-di-GMP-specific phosphodiesterase class I)/FixJ family two-component response regulator